MYFSMSFMVVINVSLNTEIVKKFIAKVTQAEDNERTFQWESNSGSVTRNANQVSPGPSHSSPSLILSLTPSLSQFLSVPLSHAFLYTPPEYSNIIYLCITCHFIFFFNTN